jgi:hypothetical protein
MVILFVITALQTLYLVHTSKLGTRCKRAPVEGLEFF